MSWFVEFICASLCPLGSYLIDVAGRIPLLSWARRGGLGRKDITRDAANRRRH